MNAFQLTKIIAHFEMKTLLRSWFFRIFAGLLIIGIGIFNVAVFVDASGSPWLYRALPSSIPYANLMILNLGQAIVAVFLASEFLKQDRKNDTVEVIYARSMTNAQYILGKTLGILFVFIILNLIILIFGIGFSFISSDSAKGIADYFLYPLFISIPTLVFILGLAFFLMTLLKNQAITFILLLGYIALTIFYLNNKYYHLFDYIAYKVPMMKSSIAGFGNFTEVIIHRGMYFLIGLGLIFFTIYKLQRLPQAKTFKSFPLLISFVLIFAGTWLGYIYVNMKKAVIMEKQQMINTNNKYAFYPRLTVTKNNINLEHTEKTIQVKSELIAINQTKTAIDTIIFSLNPGLQLSEVSVNNKKADFTRELHLVKLVSPVTVKTGEKVEIDFNYSGTINENTHFLDIKPEAYEDDFNMEIFRARKRYAYILSDFVCLTSESLWYPVSGVTYATNKPAYYQPDFTLFKLNVKTRPGLTAVSQGSVTEKNEAEFEFDNTIALPKISLTIADYIKHSVTVDSIEYSIFTTKGNDYYLNHFKEFKDTLPAVIRSIKNEYHSLVDLNYGFERFSFVEVPIHFALDKHIWSLTSDAVQPEMIFYPEKGVIMEETDFKRRAIRQEKRSKENSEEISPEELQTRIFKRFIEGNLMAPPTEWYNFDVVDKYTYSIIPQYYSFVTQMKSEKWAVLNLAMEIYLRERNENSVSSNRWFFRGLNKGEKINLELKQSNLNDLLKNGLKPNDDDEDDPLTINDIIRAKGDYLFSLFKARYGQKEFDKMINEIILQNYHSTFSVDDLESVVMNFSGDTISKEIERWYNKTELPGFLIRDMQTYKVLDGEYTKYQVHFKIANPQTVDGVVVININLANKEQQQRGFNFGSNQQPDYTRNVFIRAGEAKEIGVAFTSEPARMNIFTNISENLPNNLIYEFSGFDETRKAAVIDTIKPYPLFTEVKNDNEYIVDNEDDNFKFIQESNESYLKSLIGKKEENRYKYTEIYFWNPPVVWNPVLRSGFYGKYIRSGMYTRSGEGERIAQFNGELPEAGYYDVYCHIFKFNLEWNREKRKPNYNFKIYNDDGAEEITLADEELDEGWNYMGTFYISPQNAKVELTNKSIGKMIFADAVKWVRND